MLKTLSNEEFMEKASNSFNGQSKEKQFIAKKNPDANPPNSDVVFDDVPQTQINTIKKDEPENKPSKNSILTGNINNIIEYLNTNSFAFKTNKFIKKLSGQCYSSFLLSSKIEMNFNEKKLESEDPATENDELKNKTQKNISELESILQVGSNYIFNDTKGNLLLLSFTSSSTDVSRFIFISKYDFNYFIFTQQGDELPIVKDFNIGQIFLPELNKHKIYIFGGVDFRGNYSNDLYSIEIDYNKGVSKTTMISSKNNKDAPMGFTEAMIQCVQYEAGKVVAVLYGGLTDVAINKNVYLYTEEKGWSLVKNINLPKLKGFASAVVSENIVTNGSMDSILSKHSIYIFGGRDEKNNNNKLIKIDINYVSLNKEFSVISSFVPVRNSRKIDSRENHFLVFDNDRFLSKGDKVLYLIGGKNFSNGRSFVNEILELDLSGKDEGKGINELEWVKLPVLVNRNEKVFLVSSIAFFYDEIISIDNNKFKLIIKNSSCKSDDCKNISIESELIKEVKEDGSIPGMVHFKTLKCIDKISDKSQISKSSQRMKEVNSTSSLNLNNNKLITDNISIPITNSKLNKEQFTQAKDNKKDKNIYYKAFKQLQKLQSTIEKEQISSSKNEEKQQELIKLLINSAESNKEQIKRIELGEELRFKQIKAVQKSIIEDVNQKNIEKIVEISLKSNLKARQKDKEELKDLILKSERLIEDKQEQKLNKILQLLESSKVSSEKKIGELVNKLNLNRIRTLSDFTCANGKIEKQIKEGKENFICKCFNGWEGDGCNLEVPCPNNCNGMGECRNGRCYCIPGFKNDDCSEIIKCKNDCSKNGKCFNGKCFCSPDFNGEDCSEQIKCPKDCSENGLCVYGKCLCEKGYFGIACEHKKNECSNYCSGNGICQSDKCNCFLGFFGEKCEFKMEFDCGASDSKNGKVCSGNGICSLGKCFCHPGFKVSIFI